MRGTHAARCARGGVALLLLLSPPALPPAPLRPAHAAADIKALVMRRLYTCAAVFTANICACVLAGFPRLLLGGLYPRFCGSMCHVRTAHCVCVCVCGVGDAVAHERTGALRFRTRPLPSPTPHPIATLSCNSSSPSPPLPSLARHFSAPGPHHTCLAASHSPCTHARITTARSPCDLTRRPPGTACACIRKHAPA